MSLVIARTQEIQPNTPLVFDRGEEDFFAVTTAGIWALNFEFDDGRIIHCDSYAGYYYSLYKCEFAWKKAKRCIVKNASTNVIIVVPEFETVD